jgi:hypothetical protein
MLVDTLVEGLLDEAVANRLLRHCNHTPGTSFGRSGVNYLRQKVQGFNVRAQNGVPILLMVDFMDTGETCPPSVPRAWLPNRSPNLLFRVVVREVESWLLADREAMADWLGISVAHLPIQPEAVSDPKQSLVNLARRSRRKHIYTALAPAKGISASVGPDYVGKLSEFVHGVWRPDIARTAAPSLDSCLKRLCALPE